MNSSIDQYKLNQLTEAIRKEQPNLTYAQAKNKAICKILYK